MIKASTKIFVLFLAVLMIASTCASTAMATDADSPVGRYTDVPLNAYYAEAIEWATDNHITNGMGENRFGAEATVTKSQAMTLIWRFMRRPLRKSNDNPFSDVTTDSWYYDAVLWAVENGIAGGDEDGYFFPTASVTRGEFITFLWKAVGRPDGTESSRYEAADHWADQEEILNGTEEPYKADRPCPRCDAVYYLWQAYKKGDTLRIEAQEKPLLSMDLDVFRLFRTNLSIPTTYGGNIPYDALRLCPRIITLALKGADRLTDEELQPIDNLMKSFYEYGYLPRDPYPYDPSIRYVTAMDAPLLALTAEYVYEITGIDKYHTYMEDLLPYLIKDTTEHGYILKLNEDEWWPLEYAFEGVTTENAWYCYNGSLFGTLATQILAEATGDARLYEVAEKALNAYKHLAKEFYYDDNTWCYYALNSYTNTGKVINFYEKAWVERTACEALYLLTGDEFYNLEALNRRKFTTDFYPCYLVESDDYSEAMFLRAGAPHPYYIDIIATDLEILDENHNILTEKKCAAQDISGAYMRFDIPKGAKYYRWYEGVNKELMCEKELKTINEKDLTLSPCDSKPIYWGDAFLKDSAVYIAPDRSDQLQA